jgi:hypothetical protein
MNMPWIGLAAPSRLSGSPLTRPKQALTERDFRQDDAEAVLGLTGAYGTTKRLPLLLRVAAVPFPPAFPRALRERR